MTRAEELILGDDLPLFEGDTSRIDAVYSYSVVWQTYLDSEEGIHHASQPLRFSEVYGYDPVQMQRDLGPNIHPVKHMEVVHRAGQHVLLGEARNGSLAVDERDIPLVRIVTGAHELGENTHVRYGQVVGDIPYGRKTLEQRLCERRVRLEVFEQFWPNVKILSRADAIIMHQPESPRDKAVHETYEAAHQLCDYRSGLSGGLCVVRTFRDLETNGSDISDLPPEEQLRLTQLTRLSRDVVCDMHDIVGESAERFVYVNTLFRRFEATRKLIAAELSFI